MLIDSAAALEAIDRGVGLVGLRQGAAGDEQRFADLHDRVAGVGSVVAARETRRAVEDPRAQPVNAERHVSRDAAAQRMPRDLIDILGSRQPLQDIETPRVLQAAEVAENPILENGDGIVVLRPSERERSDGPARSRVRPLEDGEGHARDIVALAFRPLDTLRKTERNGAFAVVGVRGHLGVEPTFSGDGANLIAPAGFMAAAGLRNVAVNLDGRAASKRQRDCG